MARATERLTVKGKNGVETLCRKSGMHADGNGLYLRVNTEGGQCSWVLRYMLNGKPRWMGLGAYPLFGLSEARNRARDARQLLADKVDPLKVRQDERAQAKLDAAKNLTFAQVAAQYIQAHKAEWKNDKHADQWSSTLAAYAYPVIGGLPVAAVDTAQVLKVLSPIWQTKTETASRLRGRIEAILNHATVAGYRVGPNPARWKGWLDQTLAKPSKVRTVEHHAALPYVELPAFMIELRGQDSVAARALEFAILTAARTGEVLGATWAEIDLDARIWTVPKERMKGKREHVVPLCERAVAILEAMPTRDGVVFCNPNRQKALSNMAFLMLLRRMGKDDLTAHGFRSSFRDWAGDRSAFPREVIEAALAHAIGDKTESAYRRETALEKRTALMAAWGSYCATAPVAADNVVAMKAVAS